MKKACSGKESKSAEKAEHKSGKMPSKPVRKGK